jgi:hypothetical protein
VELEADEQVTFELSSGAQYDIARKEWGFYATPSLNGRLQKFGLRAVLVFNKVSGKYYILIVEVDKEELFNSYLEQEDSVIVTWLDNSSVCDTVRKKLSK